MEFVLEIICAQKIKDGLYIKNLDLFFDSFGVDHVPKETEKFIGYKNVNPNTFTI